MPAASTSIASRGVSASSFRGHSCAVSGRLRVVLLLVGGTLAVTLLLLLLLLPPPLLRNMGSLLHLQELGPAEQAQIYHSLAKDSVTTRTADGGYICRAVDESNGNKDCRAVAGEMLVEAGEESVRSRTAFANRNVGDTQAPRIPFFGNGNTESMRGAASHLDHRVDQYRQELVKVMQSLDLTVTGLEEAAAKVGTGGRDMPAQGVRRLAAKLKQKMDKTPPRWQVNTDVLSWLLRPVPFVAGLPAAAPTPPASSFSSTPPQDGGRDTSRAAASGDDTKDVGSVTELVEERRPAPFVHGGGATATLAEDLNGQEPGHRGGGGGEQGGSSSSNRAGFNSYEDIHQIFTHMVRDWTSEGDSVRAAVYDPLLQALDHWVGWQEGAAPAGAAPTATEAVPRSRGEIRARQRRRRGQPKPAARVRRPANVLVPGAGLGRLATEIAAREYASVHANELSMTMLSSCYWIMEALRSDTFSGPGPSSSMMPASEWDGGGSDSPWSRPPTADFMSDRNDDAGLGGGDCGSASGSPSYASRNGGFAPGGWGGGNERGGGGERGAEGDGGADEAAGVGRGFFEFYPFLNDPTNNEVDGVARFRPVQFPDPDGRAALARAHGRLSFQAGEFSSVYGAVGGPFEGSFDAVVTSFFVDTAPNVVQYVATIRRALRPGGVWINCGPLHWHNPSALSLSLDEMLALVAGSGFQLEVVERLPPCAYRVEDGGGSLRVEEFKPVFWVAILGRG